MFMHTSTSALAVAVILLPLCAEAAPFCAVTGGGTNCSYFDAQTCRQAAGPSGACVVNPNEISPGTGSRQRGTIEFNRGNSGIESYRRGMEQRAKERANDQEWELRQLEIEQRRRDLARQSTDPRLLPLNPDGGIVPETHSAIMTAVFSALDMNAPGTPREWSNQKTGAYGTVLPQDIVNNMFGEPCRAFTISFNMRGQTRTTAGTACRKSGQWIWQGG